MLGGMSTIICGFLYHRKDSGFVVATVTTAMLGKMTLGMGFELLWLYTAECTPTVIRNTGVGVGSMWARFGAMISPYTFLLSDLWAPAPYILIGVLPIICSLSSIALPETRNKHLPENLLEGELFARGDVLDKTIIDANKDEDIKM